MEDKTICIKASRVQGRIVNLKHRAQELRAFWWIPAIWKARIDIEDIIFLLEEAEKEAEGNA